MKSSPIVHKPLVLLHSCELVHPSPSFFPSVPLVLGSYQALLRPYIFASWFAHHFGLCLYQDNAWRIRMYPPFRIWEANPYYIKATFHKHKILTIHGIIVKNLLVFVQKLKFQTDSLPISVRNTIHPDAPITLDPVTDDNLTWYNNHNDNWYRKSLFFKAPLLYRSHPSITENTDGVPNGLLKSAIKRRLLAVQYSDDTDDWPVFPLYVCNGLRKSERNWYYKQGLSK